MSLSLEGKGAPLGVGPAPSDEDSRLLFFFHLFDKKTWCVVDKTMWITMYQSGIECYILLYKWEKVESEHHYTFLDQKPTIHANHS